MKINSIQNVNFGYSHENHKKLEKKLLEQQTPVNKMILRVARMCNATENSVDELERQGIAKNASAINIMVDCLIPAKLFVCNIVERLFPELNYRNEEYRTYVKETARHPLSEDSFNPQGIKTEYCWRDMICDSLTKQIAADGEYNTYSPEDLYSNEDFDDTDYDEESAVDSRPQTMQDRAKINVNPTIKKNDIELEQFTPGKNSPKSLDDIVGLDKSREDIKNFILFPIKYPEEAKKREKDYGIEIPHFIVFHGPPGCGKTMLAEAIAVESDCPMYKVDLSQFGSSFVNGTVQMLSYAFDEIYKVSRNSDKPVIVFMDEMDSLLSKRESGMYVSPEDNKVVNTLLPIITAASDNNIVIIGATNMYDSIDPAAKRRIEISAYIGLPGKEDIQKLFIKELSKIKMGENLAKNEEEIKELSAKFVGYTPSNIVNIIKEASRQACVQNREISKDDILNALQNGTYEKLKEEEYLPENKKIAKKMGFEIIK